MTKVVSPRARRKCHSHQTLPLFEAAADRESQQRLKDAPPLLRRAAIRNGLSGSAALKVLALAGLGDGGDQ